MTIRSVLAAVGRFPQDDAVLSRALEIATAHRAALTVVHVIDLPGHESEPEDLDTLRGQATLAARDRIEAALAGHDTGTPDLIIRIESGKPALQLIEICDSLRPDLIVMRAHQKQRFFQKILGSTTDRMVATGQAPILVVKQPVSRPYSGVLLATDGTDDAPGMLSFVAGLSPAATLHLVQAVQIVPQLEEAMLRIGTGQPGLLAHRNKLANAADTRLRALAQSTRPAATTQVLRGDPATVLARATRSPDVDLIALGPGRTSLIRRAFIGSVSRRLLRDAACDVLICHPKRTPE